MFPSAPKGCSGFGVVDEALEEGLVLDGELGALPSAAQCSGSSFRKIQLLGWLQSPLEEAGAVNLL